MRQAEQGRPRVRLERHAVRELRPLADEFAAVAVIGGRSLARRGADGRLQFSGQALEDLQRALGSSLRKALAEPDVRLIEERAGRSLEGFLDQVLLGWLRGEPSLFEFPAGGARGSGAYLFEVMRAELHEIGLDLAIEPRSGAWRRPSADTRRLGMAPLLGGLWLGLFSGFVLELAGYPGAGILGFGAGLALGLVLALRGYLRRPGLTCSECATPVEPDARGCGRCGAELGADPEEAEGEPES